jgi:15-cis-phytoene synthase
MRNDESAAGRAVSESYGVCRAITARAGSSFPLAFRLLPADRRDGMFALYAFLRVTDDLADTHGDVDAKRAALADWRRQLAGDDRHPLFPALRHAVRTFDIDPAHLHAAIDGAEADLQPVRVRTFAELERYCYLVAGTVGLMCVRVWGCADPRATEPAVAAGLAFQLTNVLRDLGEDLARGRVYLPADECDRFGCPPEAWAARGPAFGELMRFQAARARELYRRGDELLPLLPRPGRRVFRAMSGVYRSLLAEVEASGFDVFSRRVSVPTWRKAVILARAAATRVTSRTC